MWWRQVQRQGADRIASEKQAPIPVIVASTNTDLSEEFQHSFQDRGEIVSATTCFDAAPRASALIGWRRMRI
jgi:hypothetical protein